LRAFDWESKGEGFGAILKAGGFDAVIGNPPYVDIIGIPPPQREYFSQNYSTFLYRSDILSVFFERAISLLRSEGKLGFITSNTYFSSASAVKLRAHMLAQLHIEWLVDIGGGVFPDAHVDTAIFVASKGPASVTHAVQLAACKSVEQFKALAEGKGGNAYAILQAEFGSRPESAFVIATTAGVEKLVERLRRSGARRLGAVLEFSRGYIAYDAHRGHSQRLIKARAFHAERKLTKDYKKELVGSDIGRYALTIASPLWIKFGDNLAAPRQPRFHTGPRIWIQRIRNPKLPQRLVCYYIDKHDELAASSGLTIARVIEPGYSALAFCGLLNSRLINWWYRQLYHDVNIKPADMESIPVPEPWRQIQPTLTTFV
jgi:hypothetical protein